MKLFWKLPYLLLGKTSSWLSISCYNEKMSLDSHITRIRDVILASDITLKISES